MSTAGHDHRNAATFDLQCRVSRVRRFGRYALLTVVAPQLAAAAHAGQFVMVTVPAAGFHLRRPISLHSRAGDAVRLLVEPRGEGSRSLVDVAVGETLSLTGPIGSGFPLQDAGAALLVAGGIGTAPLQFVADELLRRGVSVDAAFGFRDAGQARLASAFDIEHLSVATDDGSVGRKGSAVDLARKMLGGADRVVYVCGPDPMLHAVREWVSKAGLTAYASLEAHMACGAGVCQGCVVATRDGYRRVCVDGPVFPLDALGDAQ